MIKIFASGRFKVNRKLIASEGHLFAVKNGIKNDALINVIFVGRRKMIEIARKYKKEDVALPVLSFSYLDQKDPHSGSEVSSEEPIGEIFICYPQAVLLAAERDRGVDKMMIELVCHGIENILSE